MSNQENDVAGVSVRRMCEALGLDVEAQLEKLTDPERTPWAVVAVEKAPVSRKESKQ